MLELRLDRGQGDRAHPSRQRIPEQRALVDDRRALEIAVLRERHRGVRRDGRHVQAPGRGPVARALVRRLHHVGGLIAEGLGHLAVLALHLLRGPVLLGLPRLVRGDLGGPGAVLVLLREIGLDLLASRTGRLQVGRRVALNLRLAVVATLDRIAQVLQTDRQLRAIDRRRVLLRLVQLARLQRARSRRSRSASRLKTTTCVWSCGAAYPSTGLALSCSNRAATQRPVASAG